MTIEEWLRIADGWRDTDEAPGELIRALAAEVERLRAIETRARDIANEPGPTDQVWLAREILGEV